MFGESPIQNATSYATADLGTAMDGGLFNPITSPTTPPIFGGGGSATFGYRPPPNGNSPVHVNGNGASPSGGSPFHDVRSAQRKIVFPDLTLEDRKISAVALHQVQDRLRRSIEVRKEYRSALIVICILGCFMWAVLARSDSEVRPQQCPPLPPEKTKKCPTACVETNCSTKTFSPSNISPPAAPDESASGSRERDFIHGRRVGIPKLEPVLSMDSSG